MVGRGAANLFEPSENRHGYFSKIISNQVGNLSMANKLERAQGGVAPKARKASDAHRFLRHQFQLLSTDDERNDYQSVINSKCEIKSEAGRGD